MPSLQLWKQCGFISRGSSPQFILQGLDVLDQIYHNSILYVGNKGYCVYTSQDEIMDHTTIYIIIITRAVYTRGYSNEDFQCVFQRQ